MTDHEAISVAQLQDDVGYSKSTGVLAVGTKKIQQKRGFANG